MNEVSNVAWTRGAIDGVAGHMADPIDANSDKPKTMQQKGKLKLEGLILVN